jgi:hypothetical protein
MKSFLRLSLLFLIVGLIPGLISPTVLLGQQQPVVPYDSETLTIDNTTIGFTSAKITNIDPVATANANVAVFTVNCATGTACILRFTIDGSTPTTSHGLRALYGDTVSITGHVAIVNFKSTRETSTSVIFDSTYFH